ncbi:MAG: response regulator transcription factor [Thiotrichales bacterium]
MILICSHDPALVNICTQGLAAVEDEHALAGSFAEVQDYLRRFPAALLLLDLELPGLHDGDGVEAMLAEHHEAQVMAFSGHLSDVEAHHLVRLGVRGYLTRTAESELVRHALTSVRTGDYWVPRKVLGDLLDELREAVPALPDRITVPHPDRLLSPRQLQVAMLVARGLLNKQIAAQLAISERTVKAHVSAIFDRTETRNRTELALQVEQWLN